MRAPDYRNSIINLMASVAHGLGADDTGYVPLESVPGAGLAERPVVLLVADGLGSSLLKRFPDSHLARHVTGEIDSVFPTTTANAITAFATGVPAQQHAVTGWFTWLKELGSVAAVLPFVPRGGGASYSDLGVRPAQIVTAGPLSDRLEGPVHVVSPAYIADSVYSRFTAGRALRHGHTGLRDFFNRITRLVRQGPGYLFAYWTEIDALAHEHGIDSPEVSDHFLTFDNAFGELLEAVAGAGALVMVTADHGLIDTAGNRVVRVEEHPVLARALTLPLCGEPRAAFAYLRPGREREFEAYVRNELADAVELHVSRGLIEAGWFGLGTPSERLAERVGDYTLLMKDNWVIRDRLLSERPFSQIGVHGGASAREMRVPLIIAEP